MKTLTIRDAIMDDSPIIAGWVYVVRDGDVIFYVGSSKDPIYRLAQHLGIADAWNTYIYSRKRLIAGMENSNPDILTLYSSMIGDCIIDNAPESLEWSFDMYEKEDALTVMRDTQLAQAFPRMLELMQMDWYGQRTIVENELIEQLKPCLNSSMNEHERNIPDRYRSRRFNLSDNAVDYLNI